MARQAREQKFTSEWQKWARNNQDKGMLPNAFVWEVKVSTEDKPIAFSAVKDHQIRSLEIAKWYTFVYKLSDISRLEMPADGIFIRRMAGLLIFHWVRKGNKKFYLIDVDRFTQYRDSSKRKSLTESEAESISFMTGFLA